MKLLWAGGGQRKILFSDWTLPAFLGLALVFTNGCDRQKAPEGELVAASSQENDRTAKGPPPRPNPTRMVVPVPEEQPVATPLTNSTPEPPPVEPVDHRVIEAAKHRGFVFEELLKKAEEGDAQAQLDLANVYAMARDFEKSNVWLQKAADAGNAGAQHLLGSRYVFGLGVEKNTEQALKWFIAAASQGHESAQYSLGVRYVKGDGLEQNFEEAAKWFHMAAKQGSPLAQLSLGRRYAAGEGVAMDKVEAYKWYQIAAPKSTAAAAARDQIAPQLTPEQIAEGEARASAFVPQPGGVQ